MTIVENNFRHIADNDFSQFQQERNRTYLEFWLNHVPDPDASNRELVTLIGVQTGMSQPEVRKNLRVARMLQRMPKLRELATTHLHLCPGRLFAVEKQVCGIEDPKILERVDAAITAFLSPQAPDDALVQPATITRHLRAIVAEFDPPATSEKPNTAQRGGSIKRGDQGFTRFSFALADDEAHEVRTFLERVTSKLQRAEYRAAKDEGRKPQHFTFIDALLDVIRNNTHAHVSYNLIRSPEGLLHLNGVGPVSDTWLERAEERTLSTDAKVESYAPSEDIRVTSELLDGHCRFPGCDVPAIYCEKDHNIPYADGGETSVANIYNLCAYHHQGKTECKYYYKPGADRQLTWYYPNGLTKVTYPHGPAVPRRLWGTTYAEAEKRRMQRRRNKSRQASQPNAV